MKKDTTPLRSWWEFLTEAPKPTRKSGRGLERSLHWFLDTGPQKKGGYQNRRARFGKKKSKNISPPAGAPGGLEEEVDPESFKIQDGLEPNIWADDQNVHPHVRDRLLTIASDFLDSLDVPVEMVDITFTGSLANYNWSDYSDIDLHIVVDFDRMDSNSKLVKKFFDASRLRWNDKHAINLYGYEVEIYVENVNEEHHSTGVYSLLREEWLKEPDPTQLTNAWTALARKKSDDMLSQINLIQHIVKKKPKAAIRSIERLKSKISVMRQKGLKSHEGESSVGNVVFKILRREGALDQLSNLKTQAYDSAFSL
tara:strand:+ start:19895 stop:20827 length:933 start_codon:yes stop_codon:yes gene_type:complete